MRAILRSRRMRLLGVLAVLLVAFALPLVLEGFTLFLATSILILGLYGAAYDVVYGYTGLLSFGHAIFFGVGGYAASLAIMDLGVGVFLAVVIGMVLAGVFAVLIGWVVVRIPSLTGFIVVTLILGTLVHLVSTTWNDVTGGTDGFIVPVPTVTLPLAGEFSFFDIGFAYYFVLVFTLGSFLVLYRFIHSPTGLVLRMVRGNEERAEMLGYNTTAYKLVSFAVSGVFAGLAGVLNIFINGYTSSANFGITTATDPILVTIIGGRGSLFGAFIGAGFVEIAQDQFSGISNSWPFFIGLLLIVTVLIDEEGIVNILRRLRDSSWLDPGRLRGGESGESTEEESPTE